MTGNVHSVKSDDSVREAATMMLEHKIGCILVKDGKKMIGIITEADFLKISRHPDDPFTIPVSKLMSTPLITIEPDLSLTKAGKMMKEKGIRRLPVKDGEEIIGIVTSKDLLRIGSLSIGNVRRWIVLKLVEYSTMPFR